MMHKARNSIPISMSVCSHKYKLNIDVCADENTRLRRTIRKSTVRHPSRIFSFSQPLFDGFRWSTFFPLAVVLSADRTGESGVHLHPHLPSRDGVSPFYVRDKLGPNVT